MVNNMTNRKITKELPQKVYGVDFSGSVDAGKKIWIAECSVSKGLLHINRCYSGSELNGSANNRDVCLNALCEFIKGAGFSIFGFDFPFGLPEILVDEQKWAEFAGSFRAKYKTPDEFRKSCATVSKGKEFKRETDRESKAPFSPYNLRLYRQTYYGIGGVIGPLVAQKHARALPMQKTAADKPWLIEVCPASTLKDLGLYTPYKGKEKKHYDARKRIIETVLKTYKVTIDAKAAKNRALNDPNGDALDGALAAIAAFRSLQKPEDLTKPKNSLRAIEGHVYF